MPCNQRLSFFYSTLFSKPSSAGFSLRIRLPHGRIAYTSISNPCLERIAVNTQELFTPFTLNGATLRNRTVMAPMTRNHSPGGVPGTDVAAYYRRRAEGGVGLIITEGTAPNHPEAKNMPNVPHMYGEE